MTEFDKWLGLEMTQVHFEQDKALQSILTEVHGDAYFSAGLDKKAGSLLLGEIQCGESWLAIITLTKENNTTFKYYDSSRSRARAREGAQEKAFRYQPIIKSLLPETQDFSTWLGITMREVPYSSLNEYSGVLSTSRGYSLFARELFDGRDWITIIEARRVGAWEGTVKGVGRNPDRYEARRLAVKNYNKDLRNLVTVFSGELNEGIEICQL